MMYIYMCVWGDDLNCFFIFIFGCKPALFCAAEVAAGPYCCCPFPFKSTNPERTFLGM